MQAMNRGRANRRSNESRGLRDGFRKRGRRFENENEPLDSRTGPGPGRFDRQKEQKEKMIDQGVLGGIRRRLTRRRRDGSCRANPARGNIERSVDQGS